MDSCHIFTKLNAMQILIVTTDAAKNTNLVVHHRQAGQGPIKHAVQAGQKVTLVVDGVTLTGAQTVAQKKLRLVKMGNDLIVETADGSEKLVELSNFNDSKDAILYGDQWIYAQDTSLQALADGITYAAILSGSSAATVAGSTVGAFSGWSSVLGGTLLVGGLVIAGNPSETEKTGPAAPVVSFIRDTDGDGLPTISGTAQPGATVTIVDPQGRSHTTTADANGNFTLELASAPTPLTGNYVVTARDATGNTSLPTTVVASDLFVAAPTATVRDTDGDGLPTVSGTTEPGATVTIVDPQGNSHTVTADGSGNYGLELNPAPTPLLGNYVVTARDAAGNTSLPTTVVTTDLTAPVSPTVNTGWFNTSTPTISGIAVLNAGETLNVTFNGATYNNVAVTAGTWQIDTSTAVPSSGSLQPFVHDTNYEVTATAQDAAGNSMTDSSTLELRSDFVHPTVTISGNGSAGTIRFYFNESPLNFDASDITVINGTKGALTMVDATTYDLAVTPAFAETSTNVRVDVGTNAFRDAAGNWNSVAAKNETILDTRFTSPTFTRDITSLDVAYVTSAVSAFSGNHTFNQDISGWNTSSMTIMENMFGGATAFDRDIGDWDISSLTNATDFLNGSGMSTANVDRLLAGWSDVNRSAGETGIQNNVALGLLGMTYTDATSAQYLTDTYGWALNGSLAPDAVVGDNTLDDALQEQLAGSGRMIHGLGGADTITGSSHADTIVGGADNDTLTGGAGSDTFRYHFTNEGVDTIMDFNRALVPGAGGDVLDLHYLLDGATFATIGDFIQLADNGGDVLRFDVDANGADAGGTGVSIILNNTLFSDASGGHVAYLQDMITRGNLVI